eukprot:COSAG01_NODE_7575_length_3142_cov_1.938547_2_plen_307_part_00
MAAPQLQPLAGGRAVEEASARALMPPPAVSSSQREERERRELARQQLAARAARAAAHALLPTAATAATAATAVATAATTATAATAAATAATTATAATPQESAQQQPRPPVRSAPSREVPRAAMVPDRVSSGSLFAREGGGQFLRKVARTVPLSPGAEDTLPPGEYRFRMADGRTTAWAFLGLNGSTLVGNGLALLEPVQGALVGCAPAHKIGFSLKQVCVRGASAGIVVVRQVRTPLPPPSWLAVAVWACVCASSSRAWGAAVCSASTTARIRTYISRRAASPSRRAGSSTTADGAWLPVAVIVCS